MILIYDPQIKNIFKLLIDNNIWDFNSLNFPTVTFSKSLFNQTISFDSCIFQGRANFIDLIVKGNINIENCNFIKEA